MTVAAGPVVTTPLVGRTLGGYRILRRVGGGGMASVYLASDPARDRQVALKLLPPVLAEIPQFSERFRREARLLMRLKHPHIAPVEEMREDGEFAYLVMPYYKHGSLADRMARGPLPLEVSVGLVLQTADALDYAHRQGVVHRDVKPSNILLDARGNALLSDFGLALTLDASVSLTGSALLGTPAYISPELAQSAKVDAHSDQYSLGIILFELLTGRLPFDDPNPMAVILKHVNHPLPSPRNINPDLPEALERVVLKATAKKAKDRFSTIESMAQALRQALQQAPDRYALPLPTNGDDPSKAAPQSKGIRALLLQLPRNRRIALFAALGIGILALGAALLGARGGDRQDAVVAPPAPVGSAPAQAIVPAAATMTQPATQLAELPTEVANPTATPRRLELPATPTPALPFGEDDLRAALDLEAPNDFDYFDVAGRWFAYDRSEKAAYWYLGGQLHGKDYKPEEHNTWWSTTDRQSGNLYVEITAVNGDCIDKDSVGLAIRVDPEQQAGGYSLEISCDGHWRMRRHSVGEQPYDLTDWASAPSINIGPGASNRIGIWAYLDSFTLYVNNQVVGQVQDVLYSHKYGTFAVFVRASRTYDLTASFDDFALWHVRYIP